MDVNGDATRVLAGLCDDRYDGFGVVFTDSEIVRRIPKRRAVTRDKEQRRLSEVVTEVVTHLQRGGSVASARMIAETGGFAASIAVTQGYERLVHAVAERLRSGDNAWADTARAENVVVLHFWQDPTHGRAS